LLEHSFPHEHLEPRDVRAAVFRISREREPGVGERTLEVSGARAGLRAMR
jgi:hypothetical protein